MSKKTFASQLNPAMQFISQRENPEPDAPLNAPQTPPQGFKIHPRYVETKSRRLNLLMQPSLYERVSAQAKAQGLSVNEFIHEALEFALEEPSVLPSEND